MRTVLTLTALELRRFARARTTLLAFTVAPVLVAAIAAAGLGARSQVSLRVVVAAPGVQSAEALARLRPGSTGGLDVSVVGSAPVARDAVMAGRADAAVILPPDGSRSATVRILRGRGSALAGDVAEQLALRYHAAAPAGPGEGATSRLLRSDPVAPRMGNLEAFAHVIAVFFSFLAAGAVLVRLHDDRTSGTLARATVAPVRQGSMLLARAAAGFVAAALELALMAVATAVLLGATWGDPVALAVVIVSVAALDVALAGAIVALTGTAAQATTLLTVVSALLGVLGGGFVPLRDLPDVAHSVADVTPVGIATSAMAHIAANGAGVMTALGAGVAISAYTVAVGLVALARGRRLFAA